MKTRKILFEDKIWKYDSEMNWFIYDNKLSNAGIWRMDGRCLQVKRKGISFTIKDLKCII